MDITENHTNSRNSPSLSGLRNWCAISRVADFVADASKRNHHHCRHLYGDTLSPLQNFGQKTLVEYLSDKLEKDIYEQRINICGAHERASKNRKINSLKRLELSKRAKKNDRHSAVKIGMTPSMITTSHFNAGNCYETGTTKFKKILNRTIKQQVDKQRSQMIDDILDVHWSKSEEKLVNVLSRISLSSNSDSSVSFLVSPRSKHVRYCRRSIIPQTYIIGRHFFNLLGNSKCKINQRKGKKRETSYEIKPTRVNLSVNGYKFNKKINGSFIVPIKNISRKSHHVNGKMCRSEQRHPHNKHIFGYLKSKKPKVNTTSKYSYVTVDSETSGVDLSRVGSRKEGESFSSSASNFKPLRTALKANSRGKRHKMKRCVRFDCNPCANNAASVMRIEPPYGLAQLSDGEHSEDESENQITSCARWNPGFRYSIVKNVKSSSFQTHSSPPKLGMINDMWQPVTSYSRLKSDDDSPKNELGTVIQRPTLLPRRKFQDIAQSATPNRTRLHRSRPNRSAYSRLHNQGESRSILLQNFNNSVQ